MRLAALLLGLAALAASAQAASGVRCLDDDCSTLIRTGSTAATDAGTNPAPLFSFASPTAFDGYAAYAGLPASDGCYAAASVTGTKGEALSFTRATTRFCPTDGTANEATGVMCASGEVCISTLNGRRGTAPFRAGQNSAQRSEEFNDNGVWPIYGSLTRNGTDVAVAPDGTTTAERMDLVEPAPGAWAMVQQGIGSRLGSVWLRTVTGTGTVYVWVTNGTDYYSTACALTTTWRRCTTPYSAAFVSTFFSVGNDDRAADQTPVADVNFYIWGGQAETPGYATTVPTPYVKTTEASATRNAEVGNFSLATTIDAGYSMAATVSVGGVATQARYAGTLCAGACGAVFADPYDNAGTWTADTNTGAVADGTSAGKTRFVQYHTGAKLNACSGTESSVACGTEATVAVQATPYDLWRLGLYDATNGVADGHISNVCIDTDSARCR